MVSRLEKCRFLAISPASVFSVKFLKKFEKFSNIFEKFLEIFEKFLKIFEKFWKIFEKVLKKFWKSFVFLKNFWKIFGESSARKLSARNFHSNFESGKWEVIITCPQKTKARCNIFFLDAIRNIFFLDAIRKI